MKKLVVLLIALCALVSTVACGGGDTGSESGAAATVTVKNMSYSPASVTIKKGQTVEWVFDDSGLPHDVVEDSEEAFKSDLLTSGTFRHTFDDAGTFDYHCTPHPMMVGTVVVQ